MKPPKGSSRERLSEFRRRQRRKRITDECRRIGPRIQMLSRWSVHESHEPSRRGMQKVIAQLRRRLEVLKKRARAVNV